MRHVAWLLAIVLVVAIARADPATGTVVISCNESDATLLVDGVLIPERAPAVLALPVGQHTIEVRKPGLNADKKVVDVVDQQTVKVRFELLPPTMPPLPDAGPGSGSSAGSGSGSAVAATGSATPKPPEPPPPAATTTIEIATQKAHAIAYLDGAPLHEAPCKIEVEPGEHVVAVWAPGLVPAETVIQVKAGDRQQIELTPSRPRKKLDVP